MTSAKASRQANAADEQIVRNVLASLKNTCNHVQSQPVLAWEIAAMHLALRRDYNRSDTRYQSELPNGDTLISVRSDSQPGHWYTVTVHPTTHPTCSCLAAQRGGRPCKHAGIALETVADRHERARRAGVPVEYWWMTRGEWLDLCEEMYEFYTAKERRAEGRW